MLNIIKKNSPNFHQDRDGYSINGICMHITGDSNPGQAVNWLCNPQAQASAHFVIEKSGEIIQLVDCNNIAWHCGIVNHSTAKIFFDMNQINPNDYLVGIECVSNGEPLTDIQYKSLKDLTLQLCMNYSIPLDRYHIIGHYELDSIDRAFDPIDSYSVDKLVNDVKGGIIVVEQWMKDALKELAANGIINSPTYWEPKLGDPITVGQVMALLNALYKNLKK